MIRLATSGDMPLIESLLREYAEQTTGSSITFDPVRYERRLQRWPLIQAVDDVAGVFCELKVRETGSPTLPVGHPARTPNAEFSGAFPRGSSKGLIAPVFTACAKEAIRLLRTGPPGPLKKYTLNELRTWQVWGTFMHGQDAQQVPDGGESICKSWETFYLARGRLSIVAEQVGGTWIARMLAQDLADDGT